MRVRSRGSGVLLSALAALASIATGCGSSEIPSSPPPTPTSAPTPSATPSPQTLRVVVPLMGALDGFGSPVVTPFLHASLFRLDEHLDPVPELADGPCVASDDDLLLTCGIRPARFHDGTPVTADDVAFTLGLGLPPCTNGLWCGFDLASVMAIDERHVAIRLARRSASVYSTVLANNPILPRHVFEASYQRFIEKARTVDLAALEALADRTDEVLGAARPDCASLIQDAAPLLAAAGATTDPAADYPQSDGSLDTCSYAGALGGALRDVVAAVRATGPDALGKAIRVLDTRYAPVGAGPWRLDRLEPGKRLELVAFDDYVGGRPAIDRVSMQVQPNVTAAIDEAIAGRVDWLDLSAFEAADLGDGYGELQRAPGIRLMTYPDSGFYALMYNLRPGRLFADARLREAVERCVDKPAAVDAATVGEGIPVYSWVSPASFAFLSPPDSARDVAGARQLIEAAGWKPGKDGVYAQPGGRRLALDVPVRSDTPDRIKFLDLIAFQLQDCGIELKPKPLSFDLLGSMTGEYPHLIPGTKHPFDAYFGGWGTSVDPDSLEFFHSRNITTAKTNQDPDFQGFDYTGYANPRVDELIDAGKETLDPKQRARIYRELQDLIAHDRPYLFAWSTVKHDAIATGLTSLDGPLDPASPAWSWARERWTLAPGS